MQGFYRLRQFAQGLLARVQKEERDTVVAILPAAAAQLFFQLPIDAQRHSLNVLRDLRAAGNVHPELAVAALLHDTGKLEAERADVRIQLWLRGPLVLLKSLLPAIYQQLASNRPNDGWHYALYVYQAHPQIGAAWARTAGCSELACWLIEHHQDALIVQEARMQGARMQEARMQDVAKIGEQRELLRLLQWADERN